MSVQIEELKRLKPQFTDERGSIFDLIEEQVGHVGLITSNKGAVRGKHYHKKSTQFTFLLSGKMEFFTKDLRHNDSKIKLIILEPYDLIVTPPNVAHAMRALENCVFLDCTTESRGEKGYEEDTVRIEMEV